MIRLKRQKFFLNLFILAFSCNAYALKTYTVSIGDTLSSIVESQTQPPPPLYGVGGRLERVLKLNPNIANPNDIRIGDVIILDADETVLLDYMIFEGQKRSLLPRERILNPLEFLARSRNEKKISLNKIKPSIENLNELNVKKISKNKIADFNIDNLNLAQEQSKLKVENKNLLDENLKLKYENSLLKIESDELSKKIIANTEKLKVENIQNPLNEISKINNDRKISSVEPDLIESEKRTSNLTKEKILEEDKKIALKDRPFIDDGPGSIMFGLGWGPSFYMHDQKSDLGSAQLSTLFLNNFEFFSLYEKDNFKLLMKLSQYSYNYDDGITSSSTPILSFSLDTYFNNFIYGIAFEQQPLLRNSSGKINVFTDTIISPRFGYMWDFVISKRVETRFQFQPVLNFSVGGNTSDASVENKEHSGYGLDVDTRIIRRLNSDSNMKIYYFWDNGVSYRSYQRSTDWGSGPQDFDSTHTNFNSTIGISIKFDD